MANINFVLPEKQLPWIGNQNIAHRINSILSSGNIGNNGKILDIYENDRDIGICRNTFILTQNQ